MRALFTIVLILIGIIVAGAFGFISFILVGVFASMLYVFAAVFGLV